MISLNQNMHLGRMAFILLLFRRVVPGFVLFIIAVVVSGMRDFLLSSFATLLRTSTGQAAANAQDFPKYFSYGLNAFFVVSIALMAIGLIVAWLEYRNYSFRFEEFNLMVGRGILWTEEVSIPYRQMQDININRSLAHRILGVSRLIIDSAGHEEAEEQNETDIILDPLEKSVAEEVRQFLDRRVGVQIVKDVKLEDREDTAVASV